MRALALLLLLVATACGPDRVEVDERQKKVDDLAAAFAHWVTRYYEARFAEEEHVPGPSTAARLRAREDFESALRALGLDMPEGEHLAAALGAARDVLVAHDYVFLPLSQAGELESDELGIALGRVRRREAARSRELWGKKVDYKLVIYDPVLYDYPTWKAKAQKSEGPVYSPGRFSAERSAVYIDHDFCVKRARAQPPATQSLGIDGILAEVELRQAAYLLFSHEVKGEASLPRYYERILWTVCRYGDPDLAWSDVTGIAAEERYPAPLREAARRVRSRLPTALDLPSKEDRREVMKLAAESAWREID